MFLVTAELVCWSIVGLLQQWTYRRTRAQNMMQCVRSSGTRVRHWEQWLLSLAHMFAFNVIPLHVQEHSHSRVHEHVWKTCERLRTLQEWISEDADLEKNFNCLSSGALAQARHISDRHPSHDACGLLISSASAARLQCQLKHKAWRDVSMSAI